MFTALTLSMALGAPIPAAGGPVPAGVAPHLMELKANADGKVVVNVRRSEQVQIGAGNAVNPGGAAPAVITRVQVATKAVELGQVKDLTITTADGKKVSIEDAVKKIADGAIVVVSSDGKAVSPVYLKVFKDETLVLASPELAGAQTGIVRPGVRPLPAVIPPGGGVQIQPGNIQILPAQGGVIQGGVIQVQVAPGGAVPAVQPAPPPVPVEKVPPKNDK